MGSDRSSWMRVGDGNEAPAQLVAARARAAELEAENAALRNGLAAREETIARLTTMLRSPDHSRLLAMQAWFCSRGANGAGQWPGDPDDFAKQIKAREEFDAWWKGAR